MAKHDDLPKVPKTLDEVQAAIAELVRGVNDPDVAYGVNTDGYGKCVEAMARAAYIAHEWVASQLGVTGFQHSMSSLHIVGMLRGFEGPYMLIDANDLLYPHYDTVGRVQKWIASPSMRKWLAEEAVKKLAALSDRNLAAERVVEHWRALVANAPTEAELEAE